MIRNKFFRQLQRGPIIFFALILFLFFCQLSAFGQEAKDQKKDTVCAVYISGIGCSNCAVTDPVLFIDKVSQCPNLIIVEYEIFKSHAANSEVKDAYFGSYIPKERPGVPFLIFSVNDTAIGRFNVTERLNKLDKDKYNACPMPDGSSVDFSELDLSALYGKFNLWTKNRVFIPEDKKRGNIPKELFFEDDFSGTLNKLNFIEVKPVPVPISDGEIKFQKAVKVNGWRFQWNGSSQVKLKKRPGIEAESILWVVFLLIFFGIIIAVFDIRKEEKGYRVKFNIKGRRGDWVVVLLSMAVLSGFFVFAKKVSPVFLEKAGYHMPLPLFTLIIALIDGFNPCNMFVLSCLLVLLVTTSHDRKRLYAVSLSFVFMVFIFYFLFMAAWLNVFKTMQFVTPLRVSIAIIALVAGIINCKELLFFKKGISLTIPEKQKSPLLKRINSMKKVIASGSYPLLISSSLGLAALSSLVELPCTAGFPIIYTGVLSGKTLHNPFWYYSYLVLYNVFYVLPLLAIVSIFIYTFRAKYITQRQVEVMKFIGGFIMIVLGIILLVNPGLIGLKIG